MSGIQIFSNFVKLKLYLVASATVVKGARVGIP